MNTSNNTNITVSDLQQYTTENILDAIQLVGVTILQYKIKPTIKSTIYKNLKESETRTWFRDTYLTNVSSNFYMDSGTYIKNIDGVNIKINLIVSYNDDGIRITLTNKPFKTVTIKRKSKSCPDGQYFTQKDANTTLMTLVTEIKNYSNISKQEDDLLRNGVASMYGDTIIKPLQYITLITDEERNQFILDNFTNTELLNYYNVANDSDGTITSSTLDWSNMTVKLIKGF